jgi:phenylalanine ammonia-lyase
MIVEDGTTAQHPGACNASDERVGDCAPLVVSGEGLTIADVTRVARHGVRVQLSDEPTVTTALHLSCARIRQAVDSGDRIYGVTTGYGAMASVEIPRDEVAELQQNLLWHLTAGTGRRLSREEVRAAMIVRANSHMRGASGIRLELVRRLEIFLNANATPHVREFGSIGASGDLVPLASITAAVIGLGPGFRVDFGGEDIDALTALDRLGLPPVQLGLKEGLAMVNGTSAMTGIAALCVHDAWSQLILALGVHALAIQALAASTQPFDPFIHRHKPHRGQVWAAHTVRAMLDGSKMVRDGANSALTTSGPVQDRYSVRCLPQFIGPIADGLANIAQQVETEINSTTDNPLIDVEGDAILHGGNFLGQYVGVAMDQLRHHIGLLAKHLDAQIAVLVTPEFSGGLSPSLVGNAARRVNMGLKGLQITANSIMPLLGFLGMSFVDRFPTHAEQFNQNINSLGFGAARLARESIAVFNHYLAVALLFGTQAVELRTSLLHGHYDARRCLSPATVPVYDATCDVVGRPRDTRRSLVWDNDERALDELLAALVHDLVNGGRIAAALASFIPADITDLVPIAYDAGVDTGRSQRQRPG